MRSCLGHVSAGTDCVCQRERACGCAFALSRAVPARRSNVSPTATVRLFIDLVTGGQLEAALINRPRARLSLDSGAIAGRRNGVGNGGVNGGPTLPPVIELAQVQNWILCCRQNVTACAACSTRGRAIRRRASGARFEIDVLSAIVKLVENTGFATILPSHRGRTF